MTHLSLGAWLSDLDRDALARIIANRPETRLPRPAATLTELVTRLSRRPALLTALYTAPTPAAQVVEMVAALDEGPAAPVARIATGFGVAPDDADLAAVLDWLADRALAWRDGPTLCVPPVLLDAFPFPHRLGPPSSTPTARCPGGTCTSSPTPGRWTRASPSATCSARSSPPPRTEGRCAPC
ncbi:hypothetical protein ACFQX7_24455 [Luedemannella flava]